MSVCTNRCTYRCLTSTCICRILLEQSPLCPAPQGGHLSASLGCPQGQARAMAAEPLVGNPWGPPKVTHIGLMTAPKQALVTVIHQPFQPSELYMWLHRWCKCEQITSVIVHEFMTELSLTRLMHQSLECTSECLQMLQRRTN